jgi:hypothetical protein
VGTLPTILIAGGSSLYVQLLDPFPPTVSSIVYAETAAEALDEAASASVVVVDSALKGGGVDLCRRLRTDAVTSRIPLVLRVANESDAIQALTDARVKTSDFHGLVKTIRRLCPELSSAPGAGHPEPEGAPEARFNDEVKTIIYRRPEGETGRDWPPPPPQQRPDQDLVEFTQDYAGYMNSLIEALEAPARLSGPEVIRLGEMSTLLVQRADTSMSTMQSGINEALMAKDLARMRVLSAAKNSLYEKLQRIRGLIGKLEARPAGEPAALKPGNAPQQKKSELTRAAEAKHAADLAAQKAAQKERRKEEAKGRPQVVVPGASRRESTVPSWVWLAGAVIAIAIAVFVIVRQLRTPDVQRPTDQSNPPTMVMVALAQTEAGVLAQPKATDKKNDRVSFAVRWFVNGVPIEGERTLRLPPSRYQSGDRVQAEITPSDSTSAGQPMRSEELLAKTIVPAARPAPRLPPDAGRQWPPAPAPLAPAPAPSAPARTAPAAPTAAPRSP